MGGICSTASSDTDRVQNMNEKSRPVRQSSNTKDDETNGNVPPLDPNESEIPEETFGHMFSSMFTSKSNAVADETSEETFKRLISEEILDDQRVMAIAEDDTTLDLSNMKCDVEGNTRCDRTATPPYPYHL